MCVSSYEIHSGRKRGARTVYAWTVGLDGGGEGINNPPFPLFALLRPVDMNRSATSRPRPVHYWRWLVIAACIGWMAGNSHKAEVKSSKQEPGAAGAQVVHASTGQNGQ